MITFLGEAVEFEPFRFIITHAMAPSWLAHGLVEGKHFVISEPVPTEEESPR